jgi:hypothetical protein
VHWHHIPLDRVRSVLLTDFWLLDRFILNHPPIDVLMAARYGYRAPASEDDPHPRPSPREAARMNSEALAQLPMRKKIKKLAEMPAFLRTPDQLKMVEEMKKRWQTNSE